LASRFWTLEREAGRRVRVAAAPARWSLDRGHDHRCSP